MRELFFDFLSLTFESNKVEKVLSSPFFFFSKRVSFFNFEYDTENIYFISIPLDVFEKYFQRKKIMKFLPPEKSILTCAGLCEIKL